MRTQWLLILAAAALAAVVAGCGGGSSSGPVSGATSSTGAGAEATAEAPEGESGGDDFLAEVEANVEKDYAGRYTKPPTSAPPHKPGVNIWIISCGEASQGCAEPTQASREAAEALGWNATVFDGKFGEGDAYNQGIRQALAAGAEVILLQAISCNQAKVGFEEAHKAGIVFIGSYSYDCNDPQINEGPPMFTAEPKWTPEAPTMADLQKERGRAKVDWVIAHTEGKAKLINTNFAGTTSGVYENEVIQEQIGKCAECEILEEVKYNPTDLANGVLKQAWASALTKNPTANSGIVLNDGIVLAAGMSQAVQSAGRTKTFALMGGDGYAPNLELIEDENGQSAAVASDPNWMAWGAVDTALRALDGKKPVYEGVGVQTIDKEHNLPPKGQNYTPSVDYKALYKKAWGVG